MTNYIPDYDKRRKIVARKEADLPPPDRAKALPDDTLKAAAERVRKARIGWLRSCRADLSAEYRRHPEKWSEAGAQIQALLTMPVETILAEFKAGSPRTSRWRIAASCPTPTPGKSPPAISLEERGGLHQQATATKSLRDRRLVVRAWGCGRIERSSNRRTLEIAAAAVATVGLQKWSITVSAFWWSLFSLALGLSYARGLRMYLFRSIAVVALLAIVGCGDRNPTISDGPPAVEGPNPIGESVMPRKKPPNDQRPPNDDELREKQWNQVYQSREQFFVENFGRLPPDILKMANLFGVWPGGGLYVFQAPKLNNLWVYTSFGLTNPDMPSGVGIENHEIETDEHGRLAKSSSRLVKKDMPPPIPGKPGYGYELVILTHQKEDWPLGLLQWGVNAEILNDVGILDRVRKYKGLTIEQVNVGNGDPSGRPDC